ncbi:MAG: hypothetical protein MPJ50_02925 [Pirellulales bacterium]|nr:hypothetical protein [Pirellulales bacterium]
MLRKTLLASVTVAFCSLVLFSLAPIAAAQDLTAGMGQGTPQLVTAGPLAFGPQGILFVGDTRSATIFAIATGDATGDPNGVTMDVANLNGKVAALLGADSASIRINDVVVNPASGQVYVSVARGRGADATPVICRVTTNGDVEEFSLDNVKFSKASLPNAPAERQGRRNPRMESITDIAYIQEQVVIAGLSNEEFASKLRAVAFPFDDVNAGASVEIYHGAHGALETRSPVRTFAPFGIDGEMHVVAAYTCTPLVTFPMADLKPGSKVKGTTVAELGNRNRPLDMFVYEKDSKNYILMANNARGMMKIQTDQINSMKGIDSRISGGGTAGLKYETIEGMDNVVQLDRLNDGHALILVQTESGAQDLKTVVLP